MLLLSIGLICGAVLAFVFARLVTYERVVGTLMVDTSDPYDGPHMFLQLEENTGDLTKQSYVRFRVDVTNYLSQD